MNDRPPRRFRWRDNNGEQGYGFEIEGERHFLIGGTCWMACKPDEGPEVVEWIDCCDEPSPASKKS